MILLLVVAIAVAAALAYGGTRIARSRAREREESAAREQTAAQATAQAARARAQQEQRRPVYNEDDALTSVMPAIKLPWSNASPLGDRHDEGYSGPGGGAGYNPHTVFADEYPQPAFGGNGYPGRDRAGGHADLDTDYPAFSTLTPFQAEEEPGRPGPGAEYRQAAAPWPAAQYPGSQPGPPGEPLDEMDGNGARLGELRDPPAYPAERFGLGHRPGDQAVPGPRPGDYDMPRSRPAERLAPAARPGEQHDSAAERARRRAGQGSHRAEHAKRRRG